MSSIVVMFHVLVLVIWVTLALRNVGKIVNLA